MEQSRLGLKGHGIVARVKEINARDKCEKNVVAGLGKLRRPIS